MAAGKAVSILDTATTSLKSRLVSEMPLIGASAANATAPPVHSVSLPPKRSGPFSHATVQTDGVGVSVFLVSTHTDWPREPTDSLPR